MLWDSFQVSNKKSNDNIPSLLKISQKPFSPKCWYVYFSFKFHFFDMSWPPNCPYHAWRPLAGPLKVGRCSLSCHSLVQLIHHKQLQRFNEFEVAGYQLEYQRLTDPTKKQMWKKAKTTRKRGFSGHLGWSWRSVMASIWDVVSKLQLETSTWYISIHLDFWRVETHASNTHHRVKKIRRFPHEPRLLQLWFRVAMAFRPPPRQSGEVCLDIFFPRNLEDFWEFWGLLWPLLGWIEQIRYFLLERCLDPWNYPGHVTVLIQLLVWSLHQFCPTKLCPSFSTLCTITSSYQFLFVCLVCFFWVEQFSDLPGETSKDAPRQHESDEEIDSPTQDQSPGNMFGFMLL